MLDRNANISEDKRIIFRMGLNVGDLIIDDGDIFGDGVNVAARLETICVPGGICVSRAVRDQIRDKAPYAFEDLGEQSVKNVERPVRAFQIRLDTITSEPLGLSGLPSNGGQRLPWKLTSRVSHLVAAAASACGGLRTWTVAAVVLLGLSGAAGAWLMSRGTSPAQC